MSAPISACDSARRISVSTFIGALSIASGAARLTRDRASRVRLEWRAQPIKMNLSPLQPIDPAVTLAVIWIALGVTALAFARRPSVITSLLYPAGACIALALALTGLWAMNAPPSAAILPAGLPDLPFHVRIDALSGFFLLVLGAVAFGVSVFSVAYFREGAGSPALVCLQYHVFLAAMAFVL